MAVRRVVAAIDVVINGQRNIDRLATAYNIVDRSVQAVNRTMRTFTATTTGAATSMNVFAGAARGAATGFMNFANAIDRGRERLNQHGRVTRGFTDNILSLTKSMLLFSVLLPVVQLPQRAIESLAQFVKVGAAWQDQMRVSNALLGLSEDQFKQYNVQVQQMAIQNNVATDSMRELLQTAASSVSAIKPNVAAMNEMGKAAYDASIALELANQSARLARATGTDAKEATSTLIQVMATYGFTIEEVAKVSDSLFAITDVGTVAYNELQATLPRVTAAMGPMIQQYDKASDRMNVMNESFAVFAAMTQTMPAEQAATSFANIFKDITQMTGKQKALVTGWERIRKQQGLGAEQSLMPETLLNQGGPAGTVRQLRAIFDIRGKLVDQYVANQRKLGNTADENALRVTGQSQLMGAYFEDMRAVRGFQNISVEQLDRAQGAFEASRSGAVERGLGQRSKSFLDAQGRFQQAWTAIQTSLFQSVEAPMVAGINPITEMFSNLINQTDFKNGNFLSKLRILGGTLLTSFSDWFRGGGRGQLQTVGRDIGNFIGEAVTSFFKGGKDNVLIEAGRAFSEAFISGIAQTLPDMFKAFVSSDLTKMVAEAIAIRYITKGRVPDSLSRTLAVAGAGAASMGPGMLGGYGGGIPGMALAGLGAVGVAGAGYVALRRGMRRPIFGEGISVGGITGVRSANDVLAATSLLAENRRANPMTDPGMIPTTGRGWPGFARIFRGAGRVGGNALLSGLLAIPSILGADSDRERWGAIGGAGGGILGAGLGGLAGGGFASLATGIIGSTIGGGLGHAAGTSLFDLFHPGTGQGAGLADAEAPERLALAETFATGFDASLAVPLLTEIRDVLIRSGGGTTGGFSRPAAGATGATGTGTGRPLTQSFVNQDDRTQLTSSQAMAACGPAAAAFFAKAYGRNPTLKEAYALVTTIQGVAPDAPGAGGTKGVATLGQALTQMGAPGEVYQGANIDWGRLAEGAKAGIPGIVNIGPRGKFPGHYFQIGGYEAATNRFNVGPSGSVLKGGKSWMTPEEMMALGPSQGAIYGKAPTGGSGNVTEADIANIPNTAGTGTGPGGAGGSVVVNIQNMMNVEHMDGNTDIRMLMGQMADLLRQLSTGGSVVGQNGVVTP